MSSFTGSVQLYRGVFETVKKGVLRFTIQVQQKVVTQIEKSSKMVFADNQKGEDDMSHYHHLTMEERKSYTC